MWALIDLQAFWLGLYVERMLPSQGWHLGAERVPGSCAFWLAQLHGAICKLRRKARTRLSNNGRARRPVTSFLCLTNREAH